MATLNEIRENFHSEKGYCSVDVNMLLTEDPDFYIDKLLKYAIKAKLEEAAERAMVDESDDEKVYDTGKRLSAIMDRDWIYFSVNKDSIINTPLD